MIGSVKPVSFALAAFFAFVTSVWATAPSASNAELGANLRSAIGLGPQACELLDMTGTEYSQLVESVESHCNTNRTMKFNEYSDQFIYHSGALNNTYSRKYSSLRIGAVPSIGVAQQPIGAISAGQE